MAEQLIGVTMQEQGVSRIVAVDMEEADLADDRVRPPPWPTLTAALADPRAVLAAVIGARRLEARKARRASRSQAERRADAAGSRPKPSATAAPEPACPSCADRCAGGARLDPLIDAIARSCWRRRSPGELARPHRRRAAPAPSRSSVEGLNAGGGDWEPPVPGQRYGEFQAGVQLANRSGALNEIEFSEFVQKLNDFAESVGAMRRLPDMIDVVTRARELDQFASEHDAHAGDFAKPMARPGRSATSSSAPAAGWLSPARCRAAWCCLRQDDGAPPVLVLSFDHQAALSTRHPPLRKATLSRTCCRRPRPPSRSRPGTRRHACWPPRWTRRWSTTGQRRSLLRVCVDRRGSEGAVPRAGSARPGSPARRWRGGCS